MRFARALVLGCSLACSACGALDSAEDPDGRDRGKHEDHADFERRLRAVPLSSVVAAVAGTTSHEAPTSLEQWLSREPNAATLLRDWPRSADGALDLGRAPVTAQHVEGATVPGSKSQCGVVTILFRGTTGPTLRFSLSIPATSHACRRAKNGAPLHDGEALSALLESISAGMVPDLSSTPRLPIGGGPRHD